MTRPAVILLAVLSFAPPALAITGQVVDPEGEPVEGAKACFVLGGREMLCADTDKLGFFTLPDSRIPTLRVRASGYLPTVLAAVDQEASIVLRRAASLRLVLVDAATGEAIPEGQAFVVYTTGERKGPFPTRAGGLLVRTLPPGEVVVRGEAEGREAGEKPASLEPGERTELVIELKPAGASGKEAGAAPE